jgi:hypothetical protein
LPHRAKIQVAPYWVVLLLALAPVVLLALHVWLVNMQALPVQLLHPKPLKALVLLVHLPQLVVSVKLLPVVPWVLWLMSSTVALVKKLLLLQAFLSLPVLLAWVV